MALRQPRLRNVPDPEERKVIRRALAVLTGVIVALVSLAAYIYHEFISKYEDFEVPEFED